MVIALKVSFGLGGFFGSSVAQSSGIAAGTFDRALGLLVAFARAIVRIASLTGQA